MIAVKGERRGRDGGGEEKRGVGHHDSSHNP